MVFQHRQTEVRHVGKRRPPKLVTLKSLRHLIHDVIGHDASWRWSGIFRVPEMRAVYLDRARKSCYDTEGCRSESPIYDLSFIVSELKLSRAPRTACSSFAREAGFFGAPDGRASINFRVLYQLIKA